MSENTDGKVLSRRTVLKGLAGLGTTSSLSGCTAGVIPTRELPGTYKKDVLRYGQVLPPVSLDPVEVDDPWSNQVIRRIFDGLYEYDRKLNIKPVLADGPPEIGMGGKKYTVSLRDGPSFHDGTDLSAADVKYSFEALKREETPNGWKVDMIASIKAPGDSTVEFTLKYPYPNFGHTLTQPIVPKTVREGNTERFGQEYTAGTGPYKLHVFKEGKYATLERWAKYWGPKQPSVNWLKFINVHSGLARTMSLKTGQNDIVERVQPNFWGATQGFPNADVVKAQGYTTYYLGFNTSSKPTESRPVREAIDYLVSMDDFVEDVVGKDGRRQYGPVPPQVAEKWGFPVEEWAGIPHNKNRKRARSILERELRRMGVSGWSPTIAAPHNDYLAQKLAKKISHALRANGFRRSRAKTYHWRHFREKTTSGNQHDYSMFIAPWAGGPDPDTFLYPMLHENNQGLTNGTYYNEESVMKGIYEARTVDKRTEREKYYEKAITTLLEDRAIIPAFTLDNSFGVKRHVNGFEPHPMAEYNPELIGADGEPSLTNDGDG